MKLANDKWLCVWLAFLGRAEAAKSNGLPSIIIIIDCQEYKDLFHPSFGGKTVRNIALWSLIAAFKILWSLVDLYQHRALSIIIGWPVTRQAESSLIPFQLFTYRQLRQVLDFQHTSVLKTFDGDWLNAHFSRAVSLPRISCPLTAQLLRNQF